MTRIIYRVHRFIPGHKTDNNGLVAKDHNKKEIRRDSKTGFEKFEDYFDSDSDNTTLQGKYFRIFGQ